MKKRIPLMLSLALVLVLAFVACTPSVPPDVAPGDIVELSIEGVLSAQVIALLPGDTAFDLLQRSGADVEYSTSAFGVFVTSIGGIAGDSSSAWMFYVNGEQPMVGSDSYTPGPNDVIVWRFIEF